MIGKELNLDAAFMEDDAVRYRAAFS